MTLSFKPGIPGRAAVGAKRSDRCSARPVLAAILLLPLAMADAGSAAAATHAVPNASSPAVSGPAVKPQTGSKLAALSRGARGRAQPKAQPSGIERRGNRLFIYGDSLATDLFTGMRILAPRAGFRTPGHRTRGGTGLVRDDAYDWYGRLSRYLPVDRPDIAVVSLGGNDRQDLRTANGRLARFSPGWWREYEARVDRVMTLLKRHSGQVYWLGLPVLRSRRMTSDFVVMNRFYRRMAQRHGIVHIDVWHQFQGAGGGFAFSGPGVDGRVRQLRRSDGTHFSVHGSAKLADIVIKAIGQRTRAARR